MNRAPLALLSVLLLASAAKAQQTPAPVPQPAAAAQPVALPATQPAWQTNAVETIDVTASALDDSPFSVAERAVPAQLNNAQRQRYRQIFKLIDSGKTSAARAELDSMPRGILHPTAEAQILLAQGAGAGLTRLVDWLVANPAAPQAPQIAGLARKAGATDLPQLARTKQLMAVSLTPALQPRSARNEMPSDAEFATRARALIDGNNAAGVQDLLITYGGQVSSDVKCEWAYRAAWDAYLDLDDTLARQLGARATNGTGEWAAMGHWVAGLAAFRQNGWEDAAKHFDAISSVYTASNDLRAAGAFWAARSHLRAGHPELFTERMKAAIARDRDGFYGILATRVLGIEPNFDWNEPDFIQADWTTLKNAPGARRAAALAEIGQNGLADRELRYLATTTGNEEYEPIMRLAARLDLPATQYWLAQNPPPGMMPPMSARFPTPDWKPIRGWRVDKSLVFAHALQESKFIISARSGPGAKGAMQIMPGTARDLARHLDLDVDESRMTDPAFNVEFGQTYLEQLRDSPYTGGLLPKVIAAYNAGPGSLQKWNAGGLKDNGDVLLFMESIPFRETRHYVEVVMRNYWLYEMKAKAQAKTPAAQPKSTLSVVAANQWPRFPATTAAGGK